MPSPREQPNPPSRNRRRPETPAPGSWLWLVLLLMLVFVLLFTVGMGGGTTVSFSEFMEIARKGAENNANPNVNFKEVVWVGGERIEGELLENAKLPESLKNKPRLGKRV